VVLFMHGVNEIDVAEEARHLADRAATVEDDFAVEAPRLLPLPSEAFDCAVTLWSPVDRYGGSAWASAGTRCRPGWIEAPAVGPAFRETGTDGTLHRFCLFEQRGGNGIDGLGRLAHPGFSVCIRRCKGVRGGCMAQAEGYPRLVIISPARLRGTQLVILPGRRVLGRAQNSDLRIPDEYVSRTHAALDSASGQTLVEDLGSSGGTLLNGVPLWGRRRLHHGDLVRFGTVEARYEEPGQESDETVVVARPLTSTGPPTPPASRAATHYSAGYHQAVPVSNDGGDQYGQYIPQVQAEPASFVREVSSTKVRSRRLIVVGFVLFLAGIGVYLWVFRASAVARTRLMMGLILAVVGLLLVLAVVVRRFLQSHKTDSGGRGDGRSQRLDTLRVTGTVVGILSLAVGVVQVVQAEVLSRRETRAGTAYVDEMPPLEGRARQPTDIMANGLRITDPSAKFSFTNLRNLRQTITYGDWNTIVGTTRVPELVKVLIDGAFEPSATTVRRTQYLANLVGPPLAGEVKPKSIASFRVDEKTVVSLLFFVNGRQESVRVTALDYKQTTTAEGKVLLDTHSEYSKPPQVPAMTSYFTFYVWPSEAASRVTPEQLGGNIDTSLTVIYIPN